MFERLTVAAREVVHGAVLVAAELESAEVGTEHVLVAPTAEAGGLVCDPSSAAGRLLRHHQVDLDALRRSVLADRDRRAG